MKKYCCFPLPFKRKKEQNQNEEEQFIEAEIIQVEGC